MLHNRIKNTLISTAHNGCAVKFADTMTDKKTFMTFVA